MGKGKVPVVSYAKVIIVGAQPELVAGDIRGARAVFALHGQGEEVELLQCRRASDVDYAEDDEVASTDAHIDGDGSGAHAGKGTDDGAAALLDRCHACLRAAREIAVEQLVLGVERPIPPRAPVHDRCHVALGTDGQRQCWGGDGGAGRR